MAQAPYVLRHDNGGVHPEPYFVVVKAVREHAIAHRLGQYQPGSRPKRDERRFAAPLQVREFAPVL